MSILNSKNTELLKTIQLYHSDGALDIIAGTVLLNFGLDVLNGSEATSLFTWIPILLMSSIKFRFFLPRVGYDVLGADEGKFRNWTTLSAAGIAAAVLILSLTILNDPLNIQNMLRLPWEGDYRCLVFGILGGLMLSATAWMTALRRFYLYAAAVLLASLISYFIIQVYVPVFFAAAILLFFGIRLMVQFMRQYPEPEKEDKE